MTVGHHGGAVVGGSAETGNDESLGRLLHLHAVLRSNHLQDLGPRAAVRHLHLCGRVSTGVINRVIKKKKKKKEEREREKKKEHYYMHT